MYMEFAVGLASMQLDFFRNDSLIYKTNGNFEITELRLAF